MVSLTKKVDRLYIVIAVLSALCLTAITMCMYYIFFHTTKQCNVPTQVTCNIKPHMLSHPVQNTREGKVVSYGETRDLRVLNDPLYPPLNRSEYDIHNSVVDAIEQKQLYNTTRELTDRYRLVGYVTSSTDVQDAGGNKWKLMARQKDRNQAEFYMVPVDKNYDIKLMLTNDMVVGEKLRDIYTVPKQLKFNSPLLNGSTYEVTELPMTDFTTMYN